MKSDRTSCHRFEANQLRLLLHSAAYVLLETLRREVLKTTQWAFATMETIQLRLLKLGARVQEFGSGSRLRYPPHARWRPWEAHIDLVGVRAFDLADPMTSVESVEDARAKSLSQAQGGCQATLCLLATMRPIWAIPGQPERLVLGA